MSEITIQIRDAQTGESIKADESRMHNMDKANFPLLHMQGKQLPFGEDDIGKEVPITGMVKLKSVKFQGYNYTFDMTKVDFPDREPIDGGEIKSRKRKKVERGV